MFARQILVATGEKFLRRAQVYIGWFLFGLLLPLVAIWRQLLSMPPGGNGPVQFSRSHLIDRLIVDNI